MSNEQETSPNYKWFALLLLWVAFFLQQGTRQIYSATLPSIRDRTASAA